MYDFSLSPPELYLLIWPIGKCVATQFSQYILFIVYALSISERLLDFFLSLDLGAPVALNKTS